MYKLLRDCQGPTKVIAIRDFSSTDLCLHQINNEDLFPFILQIARIVLDLISSIEVKTGNDILTLPLIVGTMLDRFNNLSTAALVSFCFNLVHVIRLLYSLSIKTVLFTCRKPWSGRKALCCQTILLFFSVKQVPVRHLHFS